MRYLMKEFHFPTADEMRAIEAEARRAQVEEMRRLIGLAARGVKALVLRAVSGPGKAGRRSGVIARHGV